MPTFGGKYASVISYGITEFVTSSVFAGVTSQDSASLTSKFGSVTVSQGTMPTITSLQLLRGPQIKEGGLAEDRLVNITSHSLNTVTGIDLTTTGTTTIFTAPADKTVLIFGVLLQVTAADTVTVAPDTSVGLNPSTDNIFAIETLVGLDTVDDLYSYWTKLNKGVTVANGGVLDLDVDVAATATSLEVTARVIGIITN